MRTLQTLVLSVLALLLGTAAPAHAVTIKVSTTVIDTAINGNCTLVEAIQAANTDTAVDACPAGSENPPGAGDIILVPAGTYTLTAINNLQEGTNGLPQITTEMTIRGIGNPTITRTGGTTFRFFYVTSRGFLWLEGLTVTNGYAGNSGGAILSYGQVEVTDCTFRQSQQLRRQRDRRPGFGHGHGHQ